MIVILKGIQMNKILTLLAVATVSCTAIAGQTSKILQNTEESSKNIESKLEFVDQTKYCYYGNQKFKPGEVNKTTVTQVCSTTSKGLIWLTVDLEKSIGI